MKISLKRNWKDHQESYLQSLCLSHFLLFETHFKSSHLNSSGRHSISFAKTKRFIYSFQIFLELFSGCYFMKAHSFGLTLATKFIVAIAALLMTIADISISIANWFIWTCIFGTPLYIKNSQINRSIWSSSP